MSLSLGGGFSETVNAAIDAAAAAGVHNAIAAGNDKGDACTKSPASAEGAFTTAASDISDNMASFSNLGPCVDIWAPGVNIVSAYIGSNNANASLSGTSMAAPHVAGVKAIFLGESGEMSPSDLNDMVQNLATKDSIKIDASSQPYSNDAKNSMSDECQQDSDCSFHGVPLECCKPAGSKNFCTWLTESCCAGSVCFFDPFALQRDICANPTESGDSSCCPGGSSVLPDGSCFNVIADQTPNLNLHGDP
jgi:hypothetical protein